MKLNISSQDVDKLKTLLHSLSIKFNFLTQSHRSCQNRSAAVALKSKIQWGPRWRKLPILHAMQKNILSFSLTSCIAILLGKMYSNYSYFSFFTFSTGKYTILKHLCLCLSSDFFKQRKKNCLSHAKVSHQWVTQKWQKLKDISGLVLIDYLFSKAWFKSIFSLYNSYNKMILPGQLIPLKIWSLAVNTVYMTWQIFGRMELVFFIVAGVMLHLRFQRKMVLMVLTAHQCFRCSWTVLILSLFIFSVLFSFSCCLCCWFTRIWEGTHPGPLTQNNHKRKLGEVVGAAPRVFVDGWWSVALCITCARCCCCYYYLFLFCSMILYLSQSMSFIFFWFFPLSPGCVLVRGNGCIVLSCLPG